MFDYDDKEGLKTYLGKLYLLWKENKLETVGPDIKYIKTYERKALTKELADVMDTLVP
jgi:hypothetical protein